MHRKVVILLLLGLVVTRSQPPVTVNEHRHEDHDNYEDSHEDSLRDLLLLLGSESDVIVDEVLENLLNGLKKRFECEEDESCLKCLNVDVIRREVNESGPLTFESFLEFGKITLNSMASEDCKATDYDVGNSTCVSFDYVSSILRALELKYMGDASEECFSIYTVLAEGCTEQAEAVYKLLAFLYQGRCILPTSQSIVDRMFEKLGVTDVIINEERFSEMLHRLSIGKVSSVSSDDNHDDQNHDHEDHNHAHERSKREIIKGMNESHGESEKCFSEEELRSIFGYYGNLTRDQVIAMCPVFMEQITAGSCVVRETEDGDVTEPAPYTTAMKYGYGTAAVAVISLLAFVGMFFFPMLNSVKFRLVMQFLIALGVGTMSADAILHILPEVLGLHVHQDDDHGAVVVEDYTWKLLLAIGGIWTLFIFENGLKLMSNGGVIHSHNHIHTEIRYKEKQPTELDSPTITRFTLSTQKRELPQCNVDVIENRDVESAESESYNSENDTNTTTNGKTVEIGERRRYFWNITATGIMIFIGDILHNFGDGIALGAAFSQSWTQGVGTSLAILFHELPHEFGDFAIYLNNGLSKWRALILNFTSACFCFIGLYVGLAISEDDAIRLWLLAFVAGMFLYISLVNVLHELVEEDTGHPKLQFLLQNLGLLSGWGLLFVLAVFEESIVNSI